MAELKIRKKTSNQEGALMACRRAVVILFALAALTMSSGCGGGSGGGKTEPAAIDVTGVWDGFDFETGNSYTATLSQDGNSVVGTAVSNYGDTATVSGILSGNKVHLQFNIGDGTCITLDGTVRGGTASGSWSSSDGSQGGFSATRTGARTPTPTQARTATSAEAPSRTPTPTPTRTSPPGVTPSKTPAGAALYSYPVGESPLRVALGDINGDGWPDIVTSHEFRDYVSVLLNEGDGTFSGYRTYTVGREGFAISTGDINEDGFDDVATINWGDGDISVIFGRNDGSLVGHERYPTAWWGSQYVLALPDLNHDGHLDLVAYGGDIAPKIYVRLGLGNGSFGSVADSGLYWWNGSGMALGDIDGDGTTDAVVFMLLSGQDEYGATVLLGDGDGTFTPQTTGSIGRRSPGSVALADFDGDGRADTVFASSGGLCGLLNYAHGFFNTLRIYDTDVGQYDALAVGFVDNDTFPDIAVGAGSLGILLLLNDGTAHFVAHQLGLGTDGLSDLALKDVNRDGVTDLVFIGNRWKKYEVSVLLGPLVGAPITPGSRTMTPTPTRTPHGNTPTPTRTPTRTHTVTPPTEYTYVIDIEGGGGDYTSTRLVLHFQDRPLRCLASGTSDSSEPQRTAISASDETLGAAYCGTLSACFNGAQDMDVTAFVGRDAYVVLNSKWGTNADSIASLRCAFSQPQTITYDIYKPATDGSDRVTITGP